MNKYQELEIKILDINITEIKGKLNNLGAVKESENVQKIYTFDFYDPIIMYNLALSDYEITNSKNSLQKIENIYEKIEPIINKEEQKFLVKLCGYKSIKEYINNNYNNIDLKILKDEKLLNIIKDTRKRFFSWIRLRQNGERIELTIKYIYSNKEEYNIDEVKEIEILVNDFETANKLIEELGYYRKKKLEKKRQTFHYKNLEIVIDESPLLEPYIEIEGENINDIYELVNLLGYKKEDAKIINLEDLYLLKGINLNDYEVFTFDEQIKR